MAGLAMDGQLDGDSRSVSVQTRGCDGVVVTAVGGDVDAAGDLVLDEVQAQLRSHPPALILDLRAVTFLGSTGFSALVDSHRQAAESATKLLVVADHRAVLRSLAVTGLDQLLDLYPDLDTTLAAAR